jgi:acetolactate synthase-1/2/3 large subunit
VGLPVVGLRIPWLANRLAVGCKYGSSVAWPASINEARTQFEKVVAMGSIDGGEVLIRCLRNEGIEAIFALADIGFGPILRSAESAGVKIVSGRHESAQVHMADGWARSTGRPAATVGATGPGAANMLPGVVNAWVEGIPMVVISTQRNDRASRSVRRGRFQFSPQIDTFAQITKYAAVIPDARRIPEYVREAFRHLYSGRFGPVYLELGDDVLRESVDENSVGIYEPDTYRAQYPAPDETAVARALEMIRASSFPLVLAGQGVRWSNASTELRQFVEKSGSLVMTSVGARGVIPEDHPQLVLMASPGGMKAALQADLVIAVGTSIGEMAGYGRPPRWGEFSKQKWIQIDIDPLQIGVNRPVDLAIVADAGAALAALSQSLGDSAQQLPKSEEASGCVELCRSTRRMLVDGFGSSDSSPIHPARLAKEVADFFGPDAITCIDGGCTGMWAHMFHTFSHPTSLLWTSHFGHLGTGLPYAIGAKVANPDRQVYLITGDGAFGFNIQELETAARNELGIVSIVACDHRWGMEVLGQRIELGHTIGADHLPVRYDRVAKGLGCWGEFVDNPDDIASALEAACEAASGTPPVPAVLHVNVDPEVNANPPGLMEFARMYAATEN